MTFVFLVQASVCEWQKESHTKFSGFITNLEKSPSVNEVMRNSHVEFSICNKGPVVQFGSFASQLERDEEA